MSKTGKQNYPQYYHCPFPDCPRTFIKEEGQPNLCKVHRRFVADLVFALNHLITRPAQEAKEGEGEPVIFIPKPGMSNQAIEEAKKANTMGPLKPPR